VKCVCVYVYVCVCVHDGVLYLDELNILFYQTCNKLR